MIINKIIKHDSMSNMIIFFHLIVIEFNPHILLSLKQQLASQNQSVTCIIIWYFTSKTNYRDMMIYHDMQNYFIEAWTIIKMFLKRTVFFDLIFWDKQQKKYFQKACQLFNSQYKDIFKGSLPLYQNSDKM